MNTTTSKIIVGVHALMLVSLQAQPLPDLPFDSGSTGADGALRFHRNFSGGRTYITGALAYDNARQQAVLFGGWNNGEYRETWTMTTEEWEQKQPAAAPSTRHSFATAYDAVRQTVVLYGGHAFDFLQSNRRADDTWAWNGTNWLRQTPAVNPGFREAHAMSYDAARDRVVMFGGVGNNGNLANDTWAWNGTNWTQLILASQPGQPPNRYYHMFAYDSIRQKIVLFGGQGAASSWLNDTWEWDGTNWMQRTPVTSPSPREGAAFAYDEARQQMVLFGGSVSNFSGRLNDTWVWDGTNWTELHPTSAPDARAGAGATYDPIRQRVILVGGDGRSGNVLNVFEDTWTWDGTNWAPSSSVFDMRPRSDGVWHFTTIEVPTGARVRFIKNAVNTPVRWLATSNVVINGTLWLRGDAGGTAPAGSPALGGPGGFNGGIGGQPFNQSGSYAGTPGDGPGGGAAGVTQGQAGTRGLFASVYGNSYLQPLVGGSGGGGGASDTNRWGGHGSGGGGAIQIASSRDILLNGVIDGQPGAVGEGNAGIAGAGAPGSGGAVRLQADRLTVTGNGGIYVQGTGRIRMESYYRTIANLNEIQGSNTISIPVQNRSFDTPTSALRIASVAGQNVVQPPGGNPINPDVIFTATGDITVIVQAGAVIPNGTPVKLRVTSGGMIINKPVQGEPDVVLNNGTAAFSLTVPKGAGTVQAFADFTLP